MAERVEDLKVWQRAMELSVAINAIINRPGFADDRRLREQLLDASDSIVLNISEGFAHSSDRGFADYLDASKALTAEARTRLRLAFDRNIITTDECAASSRLAEEVARMLAGLIAHLLESSRAAPEFVTDHQTLQTDDGE
jgi:four helix bundle protein